MFDMGFTEVMLIGVVALVVIGPEKLPGVARTAGKYFGRLRRFVNNVKSDVESELRADELREIMAKQQEELNSIKDSMNNASKNFESAAFGTPSEAAKRTAEPTAEPEEINDNKNWTESVKAPEEPAVADASEQKSSKTEKE